MSGTKRKQNHGKPDVLRVALYIRVSTEEQAVYGDSLPAQEEALLEWARSKGHKIVAIYRDEGNSARKAAFRRPVMLELLEDVKADKVDLIAFTKLDRWFRNLREYYNVQSILDKHRVAWQAILEDYNTTTADGRLKVNIMLSVAENESDRTSERIKFVFNSKLNRKEAFIPKQCLPMGYTIQEVDGVKRVVKDPETQHIMEDFFRTALDYSVRRAAQEVTEKYGLDRDHSSWYEHTKREIFTGTYRGVKDYCPAYITQDEFDYLNDKTRRIRKTKQNRTYLFVGLLLCPACGRRMGTKFCIGSQGREYYYYRCGKNISKACDFKSTISEIQIEKYLLENVRQQIEGMILSAEAEPAQQKKAPKRSEADKLKEQLRRTNVAYHAGNMEDDEYLARTKEIKAKLAAAQAEEEKEEKPADLSALKELLSTDFETIYKTLDKEDKRRLWRSIIRNINTDVSGHITSIDFI